MNTNFQATKQYSSIAALIIGLMLCTGCHSINPSYAYTTDAQFNQLQSFAWYPESEYERTGIVKTQPAIDQTIRSILENTLKENGYIQVKRDPDFYITYHAAIERKLSAYDLNKFFSSPYGTKNTYWQNWSDPFAMSRDYEKGTLIIDIIQPRAQQLIWRGTATANYFLEPKDRVNIPNIEAAARAILDGFPPYELRNKIK